jgi:ATP-dependent protease ClpP protease subunit
MNAIYQLTALKDELKIQIFGAIGENIMADGSKTKGFTLADFLKETANLNSGTLIIEINSPGGNPFEAFAIHDAIKQLSVRVIVRIMGMAASAATIIAAAADHVEISENGNYLVHEAQSWTNGSKDKFKETYDDLAKLDNQMLSVYVKRTGKSREALSELMKEDRRMTADEALKWGFVDNILISNKQKITAMDTQIAMSEDEKKEFEALKAENKELKAAMKDLTAKLKAYDDDKEEKAKAKVKAMVEDAEKAGKIRAEAKESLTTYGLANPEGLRSMLEGIVAKIEPALPVTEPEKTEPETQEKAWAEFKAGKITLMDYQNFINKEAK